MRKNILLVIALGVGLLACARRVVIDPDLVKQQNSADWTVKSEPHKLVAADVAQPQEAATGDSAEPQKAPQESTTKKKAARKKAQSKH